VEVKIETSEDRTQSNRIVVVALGPPDFMSVKILPQPLFLAKRDLEIGDSHFDSKFFIEGPLPLVLALLNEEMRRLLYEVGTKSRVEISSGGLQAECSTFKLRSVLSLLLTIAQRLTLSIDVPRRLAENARWDPAAGVRLQNLIVLAREFPGEPETVATLRTACYDPSYNIRLWAAKELGTEGHSFLFELAESLVVDDAVSAEAVSILGRELPFERLKAFLDQSSREHRPATARACLVAFGQSGDPAAVGTLAEIMTLENELATAAAQALGKTGSLAAEPSLIYALGSELADLRAAAVNALGHVGSTEAVIPLQEAAERSWHDLELRRAIRQAIAEIQSRLPGAAPGQLSLSGAEAGQLSLAIDPAGQLSLRAPEDERS
jgi:hypothetical protein